MKKALIIVIPIVLLLVGCSNTSYTATISTSDTKVAKEEGVILTPSLVTKRSKFQLSDDAEENVIYKWQTNQGGFLEGTQNIEKDDESSVTWIQATSDSSYNSDDSIEINLTIVGIESKKIYAASKLNLTYENGSYKVS